MLSHRKAIPINALTVALAALNVMTGAGGELTLLGAAIGLWGLAGAAVEWQEARADAPPQ